MAEWLRLFFIAIQFLTRLPIPELMVTSEETLGKATRFFPLVGVVVGAGAALIFWLLQPLLPHS
ncbi:MAG: adenosylcobinamide-GDP ribazoletransferase, partial [Blastocatellia bacterium]|nr:adenosylcobinamide-GDP ribazoletransferase [Blastocatellia bacterium]